MFFPLVQIRGAQSNIEKQVLRNQLKGIGDQITQYQNSIKNSQTQQRSLKRDIDIFNKQIIKQKLQIQEINLNLLDIQYTIETKTDEINGLAQNLKNTKNLLGSSIKRLNEYDETTLLSIFLRQGNISIFFNQARHLRNIQSEMNKFVSNIDTIRDDLESEKAYFEKQESDITRLKGINYAQKASLEHKQKNKANLLNKTKGEEKNFQTGIKRSKKDIVRIKQELFALENMGISMSFDVAVQRATLAGEKAGIRPAFLLAIFQVESKMGTYLGGGNWKVDMKPRERKFFLQITKKLGLNPNKMPISKKPYYGWGGAMGAAQFIPSTWLIYEKQIGELTGNNPPSPWTITDAFMGSALKLSSNGANKKTYDAEHKTAAMYIGGGNWRKRVAQRYANTVLDWAEYYQEQIDAINQ